MVMEYVNRKGDTYYLQQGKTKTGKPKYYFGRRLSAAPLDAMPEGYEVHESPENAQVHARKTRATEVSSMERRLVEEAVARLAGLKHVIVNIEHDALVVYLPDTEDEPLERLDEMPWFSAGAIGKLRDRQARRAYYQKMMRFELLDDDERLYSVQRWCFRGSIDNWVFLAGPAPLERLVEQFAPHLGKESFFELI